MKTTEKKIQCFYWLTQKQKERIKKEAAKRGITESQVVREILEKTNIRR